MTMAMTTTSAHLKEPKNMTQAPPPDALALQLECACAGGHHDTAARRHRDLPESPQSQCGEHSGSTANRQSDNKPYMVYRKFMQAFRLWSKGTPRPACWKSSATWFPRPAFSRRACNSFNFRRSSAISCSNLLRIGSADRMDSLYGICGTAWNAFSKVHKTRLQPPRFQSSCFIVQVRLLHTLNSKTDMCSAFQVRRKYSERA